MPAVASRFVENQFRPLTKMAEALNVITEPTDYYEEKNFRNLLQKDHPNHFKVFGITFLFPLYRK